MSQKEGAILFFRYMIIGFTFSCITNSYTGLSPIEIVNKLFLTFMYHFVIGVWAGVAGLLGTGLYYYLKKNIKNEPYCG